MGLPKHIREFLVNRQTLAASETITFHAINVSKLQDSWVICWFNGNNLSDTEEAISDTIKSIQQECWKDKQLWTIIARARPLQDVFKSDAEMMEGIMATWDIIYTESVADGRTIPNYVLTGIPIESTELQQAFIRRVKQLDTIYCSDMTILRVKSGRFNSCTQCKFDTHLTQNYIFPDTTGWLGAPIAQKKRTKPQSSVSTHTSPRGREPTTRGRRGARPGTTHRTRD
jgi:hypothetical protein